MRHTSFLSMLAHNVEAFPEGIALRDARRQLTCAELLHEIQAHAERWHASGKTCLAVLCDGSLDCLCAILSASAAGLQVALLDENVPEDALPGLLAYVEADEFWGAELLELDVAPYLTRGVREPAGILFFTSGTTQASKAVVLTEASLCASAWNGNELLSLESRDTLLCALPLNHVFGFVCGVLWGLQAGATVAIGGGPRRLSADLQRFRPTTVSVVPTLLGFLLQHCELPPELSLVLVGAGNCPEPLIQAAGSRGLRVAVGYGLTETSSGVALSPVGNSNAMELCPEAEARIAEDGEILIHAPTCVMQGYYKKPEDTAAVLHDGLLHTGDLGALDELGRLRVTGRKKEMLVLTDGTKIYLPEYEESLAALLGTNELAVALRNGRPVLLLSEAEADKKELMNRLAPVMERLPRGQQLTDILILHRPLPRTATGKIKRWTLTQLIEELT